jgi:hypothetical protein
MKFSYYFDIDIVFDPESVLGQPIKKQFKGVKLFDNTITSIREVQSVVVQGLIASTSLLGYDYKTRINEVNFLGQVEDNSNE